MFTVLWSQVGVPKVRPNVIFENLPFSRFFILCVFKIISSRRTVVGWRFGLHSNGVSLPCIRLTSVCPQGHWTFCTCPSRVNIFLYVGETSDVMDQDLRVQNEVDSLSPFNLSSFYSLRPKKKFFLFSLFHSDTNVRSRRQGDETEKFPLKV